MKSINLRSLELVNFKGIKKRTILFSGVTAIIGQNGAGKTTIYDAFCWLFFGKDSQGRADYSIKTRDPKTGEAMQKAEHSVEGVIYVDGNKTVLKKTYREKWQKRRGSSEESFIGHETIYSIDDVPMMEKTYSETISQIVDEEVFKTIVNPLYFNTLHWGDRRKIILDVAGDIDKEKILSQEKYDDVRTLLSEKKEEDAKILTKAKIKRIKEEIEHIPARIDELKMQLSETEEVPEDVEAKIMSYQKKIDAIDSKLEERAKDHEFEAQRKAELTSQYWAKRQEAQEYKEQLAKQIKDRYLKDVVEEEERAQSLHSEITRLSSSLEEMTKDILIRQAKAKSLNETLGELRAKWKEASSSEYNPEKTCPNCSYDLTEGGEEAFNADKSRLLKKISEDGERTNELLAEVLQSIEALKKRSEEAEDRIAAANSELGEVERVLLDKEFKRPDYTKEASSDEEYIKMMEEADALKGEADAIVFSDPDPSIKEERKELREAMSSLQRAIQRVESKRDIEKRMGELASTEKEKSQEKAMQEKKLFLIESFEKEVIGALHAKIAQKFPYKEISFLMYRPLVNGGEEPACETMVDGVPWPDVNHGHKIIAGMKIAKSLSEHYGVSGPMWVDNAEAVVTLDTPMAQTIALYAADVGNLKVLQHPEGEPINGGSVFLSSKTSTT